ILEQEPQVFSHANAVKNLINNRQFWIDVEQLRNILGSAKRAVKNVEFRTTILADIFVELAKMAIAIQKTSALFNSQFRCDCIAIYNKRWKEFDTDLYLLVFFLHPTYRGEFFEASIYKNHVLKKALEIWKQIGGGRTSADFLKVQMSLYKNQESPFDDMFNSSINTIYNWWLSVDLKKNEDHIKTLVIRIHTIVPHNATCEQVFSVLSWYLEKRRNNIHIKQLETMAQMHSFLIENAKSELNFVNSNLDQNEFLSIFNQIAFAMQEGNDLFNEEDSFSFQEESIEEISEDSAIDLI
ncbi:9313_t:CDS:2, partial [Ambispora gerdemannii]